MEIIVFEKETYWKMQAELIAMIAKSLDEMRAPEEDWIGTEAAKKLLGIKSKSKLQLLRNTNAIRYSKPGKRNLRYSKSSILDYLKHKIQSY